MIIIDVTDKMIEAGTRSLYGHTKADPESTVVAIFAAMMQARSDVPEIEVRVHAQERQHRAS